MVPLRCAFNLLHRSSDASAQNLLGWNFTSLVFPAAEGGNLFLELTAQHAKYGATISYSTPVFPVFSTVDVELASSIFDVVCAPLGRNRAHALQPNTSNFPLFVESFGLLARGLLVLNGPDWHRHRM